MAATEPQQIDDLFIPSELLPSRLILGELPSVELAATFDEVKAHFCWSDLSKYVHRVEPCGIWLSRQVFIIRDKKWFDYDQRFHLGRALGEMGFVLVVAINGLAVYCSRDEDPTGVCDFLLDFVMESRIAKVKLQGIRMLTVSNSVLTRLLNSSSVKYLGIECLQLNEFQSRALAKASSLDTLGLDAATFLNPLAFLEAFEERHGRLNLVLRYMCHNTGLFAACIRVNNSIRALRLCDPILVSDEEWNTILSAVTENQGITELDLHTSRIRENTWNNMCELLSTHHTLTRLDLRDTGGAAFAILSDSPERLAEKCRDRTRALGAMMETNTVLQEILLCESESDKEIYQETVLPVLEMNKFRARVKSIQEAPEQDRNFQFLLAYHEKAQHDKSKFYMLLRENVDFVFQRSLN